jgi:hypothetical protein
MQIKQLKDLPQFKVLSIQIKGDEVWIFGFFNQTNSVREARSWLLKNQEYYIGDLRDLDINTKNAIFVNWNKDSSNVKEGEIFSWIPGCWNLDFIFRILDKTKLWQKVNYKPQDAQVFMQNGIRGWSKVGKNIPKDAIKTNEIISKGWDHEHCEICHARVGKEGSPIGYTDNDRYWLCQKCFKKYASKNDLAFIDEF